MAKYRILRGSHAEGKYPQGHQQAGSPIVYDPGDVIETDTCLLKQNSPGQLGAKFQLVDDDRVQATDKLKVQTLQEEVQASQPKDELDGMTVAELKELARGDTIDLGKAKTKDEIAKIIREAYAASV